MHEISFGERIMRRLAPPCKSAAFARNAGGVTNVTA